MLLLPVPLFLLFFLDSTGKRLFLVFGRPLSSFDKTIDAMGLDLLFFLGIETGLLKSNRFLTLYPRGRSLSYLESG